MKIIFLDIDGVLATSQTYGVRSKDPAYPAPYVFDQKCVKVLNEIVRKSGEDTKVVLSSDWRLHFDKVTMNEIFRLNGLEFGIDDFTPQLQPQKMSEERSSTRVREIEKWLSSHKVSSWVAIDDMPMHSLKNFVHTRENEGIKQSGAADKTLKFLLS